MTRPIRPIDYDMTTYDRAVSWLQTAWTTLPVAPTRLHTRAIEDGSQLGAHEFSLAFWRVLSQNPWDTETITEQDTCHHPGLRPDAPVRDCIPCGGDGVRQYSRSRYKSPIANALYGVSKIPPPAPDRPSTIQLVVALAASGWNLDRACSYVGMRILSDDHRATMEALMLMSIRRVYDRYSSGPVHRARGISDSQANAETAA